MRSLVIGLFLLLVALPAQAQSLNDQLVLGNNLLFQGRVRSAVITGSINIASDGLVGGINDKRHRQVTDIMSNPDTWKIRFAGAISTQPTVSGPATAAGTVVLKPMVCAGIPPPCTETGNTDTQQALVTDAVIGTAVAAVFNSFFGGQ